MLRQIGGCIRMESFNDLGLVECNGSFGQFQLVGDLLRGEALGNQLQNRTVVSSGCHLWPKGGPGMREDVATSFFVTSEVTK